MFICFLSVKQMLGIFVTYPQKNKRRLGYEHRDVLKRKGVGAHEFLKAFFFCSKKAPLFILGNSPRSYLYGLFAVLFQKSYPIDVLNILL